MSSSARKALVYFGLRDATPEDYEAQASADPVPWWRRLMATVVAIAVATLLFWAIFDESLGGALVRGAALAITVAITGVVVERLELRRLDRTEAGADGSRHSRR